MVSQKNIDRQLKKIGFKSHGWGRGEVKELPDIILPDEEIYECVNGIYDGGFALLVATDVRVLLIDQKPLNYLTVEDLRFDMINEMDYSHRLLGARISITSGSKNLKFLSYNQPKLRKLINHVQHCMAESRKKDSYHDERQVEHLARINEQLQEYLIAQQKQQMEFQQQMFKGQHSQQAVQPPEPVKPSPELADYLFAQSLLAEHQGRSQSLPDAPSQPAPQTSPPVQKTPAPQGDDQSDLIEDGKKEIFGAYVQPRTASAPEPDSRPGTKHVIPGISMPSLPHLSNALEVNPITIAYSKLPMALRNRKFRPGSLDSHLPAKQGMTRRQTSTAL